jgi:hypothetical protein
LPDSGLFAKGRSRLAAEPAPRTVFCKPDDRTAGWCDARSSRCRLIAAAIGGPEPLRHLDRHIAIQQKPADPRTTPPAEAAKLFLEGKAAVLMTFSIHATEIASTHTAVEFAYPQHVLNQAAAAVHGG